MVLVNGEGVWGKISQISLRKLTKKTKQGQASCRVSGVGLVRVSSIDLEKGRPRHVDFAAEMLSSIVAKKNGRIMDLSGVCYFVTHGANWDEQTNMFLTDPEKFECIHPRMMSADATYLYFARNVFTRKVLDETTA